MHRVMREPSFGLALAVVPAERGFAQRALRWQEVRNKFDLNLIAYLDAADQLNLAIRREVIP